jgi:hypothetical protein
LKGLHACIIFCFKLWKNAATTFTILEVAFGEQTLGRIDWLGSYARVVDHLAIKNVAQGAPLGGGCTLYPDLVGQSVDDTGRPGQK